MQTTKWLITAAFEPELAPCRAAFGARVDCLALGLGSVSAASTLSRYLSLQARPQGVIFIGSLGSYDLSVPLLSLALPTGVVWADTALASGGAYLPGASQTTFESESGLWNDSEIGDCSSGLVASTPAITSSLKGAKLLADYTTARFENLQLYGVAQVCFDFSVPWSCLSVVTNYVGPEGHQQWLECHQQAAELNVLALTKLDLS